MAPRRRDQDQNAQESSDLGEAVTGPDSVPLPNPIHVFNPFGFDPTKYLPGHLWRYGDHVRYFAHLIVHARLFGKQDATEFIPLMASILRGFFPSNYAYKLVRDAVISAGAIDCDDHYIKSEKAMGYRLGDDFDGCRFGRVEITDRVLAGKIRANREDWRTSAEGVHRHLGYWLRQVEIDHAGATEWLIANPPFEPMNELAVSMIHNRQFRLWPCSYGRVHSNLTNLKRELRGFLHYRGEPLVNLDIRNSQPLFFGVLLRDRFRGGDVPPDVRHYLELVQAGRFYDHLMLAGGVPTEDRSAFKQKFFGRVFFCRNDPVTAEARLFGSLFPNVYQAVRTEKEDDFADLARNMQRAESRLMIGRVAVRIMEELPHAFVGTIHDSVLTTEDHAEAVREIMVQEFEDIHLRPTINIETT